MDTKKAVKYAGGALAVITGVFIIAEAPILSIGFAVGAYAYDKFNKK